MRRGFAASLGQLVSALQLISQSQEQLAKLVGVPRHYVQRIEQGRRGCNPWVAKKMAEELEVDLEELRAGSALEEGEKGTEGGVRTRRGGPQLAKPRRSSLHRTYLEVLLEREVGLTYSALEGREFEDRCIGLSVEELLEIISSRERERELLKESTLREEGTEAPALRSRRHLPA